MQIPRATSVIGGSISSAGTSGSFQFQSFGQSYDVTLAGVDLQGTGGSAPIQAQANSVASISLENVQWRGGTPVFDGTAMNAGALIYFNWFGGNAGTNAQPFRFPADTKISVAYQGGIINSNLPTTAPTQSGSFWRDSASGNVLKVVP